MSNQAVISSSTNREGLSEKNRNAINSTAAYIYALLDLTSDVGSLDQNDLMEEFLRVEKIGTVKLYSVKDDEGRLHIIAEKKQENEEVYEKVSNWLLNEATPEERLEFLATIAFCASYSRGDGHLSPSLRRKIFNAYKGSFDKNGNFSLEKFKRNLFNAVGLAMTDGNLASNTEQQYETFKNTIIPYLQSLPTAKGGVFEKYFGAESNFNLLSSESSDSGPNNQTPKKQNPVEPSQIPISEASPQPSPKTPEEEKPKPTKKGDSGIAPSEIELTKVTNFGTLIKRVDEEIAHATSGLEYAAQQQNVRLVRQIKGKISKLENLRSYLYLLQRRVKENKPVSILGEGLFNQKEEIKATQDHLDKAAELFFENGGLTANNMERAFDAVLAVSALGLNFKGKEWFLELIISDKEARKEFEDNVVKLLKDYQGIEDFINGINEVISQYKANQNNKVGLMGLIEEIKEKIKELEQTAVEDLMKSGDEMNQSSPDTTQGEDKTQSKPKQQQEVRINPPSKPEIPLGLDEEELPEEIEVEENKKKAVKQENDKGQNPETDIDDEQQQDDRPQRQDGGQTREKIEPGENGSSKQDMQETTNIDAEDLFISDFTAYMNNNFEIDLSEIQQILAFDNVQYSFTYEEDLFENTYNLNVANVYGSTNPLLDLKNKYDEKGEILEETWKEYLEKEKEEAKNIVATIEKGKHLISKAPLLVFLYYDKLNKMLRSDRINEEEKRKLGRIKSWIEENLKDMFEINFKRIGQNVGTPNSLMNFSLNYDLIGDKWILPGIYHKFLLMYVKNILKYQLGNQSKIYTSRGDADISIKEGKLESVEINIDDKEDNIYLIVSLNKDGKIKRYKIDFSLFLYSSFSLSIPEEEISKASKPSNPFFHLKTNSVLFREIADNKNEYKLPNSFEILTDKTKIFGFTKLVMEQYFESNKSSYERIGFVNELKE